MRVARPSWMSAWSKKKMKAATTLSLWNEKLSTYMTSSAKARRITESNKRTLPR